MSDLLALLDTSYFRAGLRLGLAALAAGWSLRFAVGRDRPPLPVAGLLIAAATLGGLYLTGEDLGSTVWAILAIVVGVLATRLVEAPAWLQPLAAIPGSVWLALQAPATTLDWVRVLIAVLIPIAGYLISDFEMRHDNLGLGVIFFALAALGAFAAVPDTEQALVITAASVVVVLLAWPWVAASLGTEGGYAAVAALMIVVASGGEGRPPSIIGSAACLGLLLLEPVLVRLRPSAIRLVKWVRTSWAGAVVASLPHFFVVVLCSRVAARFESEMPAILIVAFVYGITLGAGLYAARRTTEIATS